MKKLKIFLITFILIFIIFPSLIKAATFLEASTQRPVVGSDVYILLNAMYGDLEIRELNVRLKYDPEYFEFQKTYWIQASGTYEVKDGYIYIHKPNNGRNWTTGNQMQFKFTVLKTGASKFELDAVDENGNVVDSYYANGDKIAQSFAGVTINAVTASNNTLLSKLQIEGYNINPTFNKNTYDYTLTVPSNVNEVNIVASKGDNNQTITGTGTKKLEYGPNRVRVVVSAQDGSSRTYQIMITRTDNRSVDTSLKSLSVSNTNISYAKDKTSYSAVVSRSIDSVFITAVPSDSMATMTGTGTKKLEIGENIFTINVISSGGVATEYTINITRSTEEIGNAIQSSKLESLKIDNTSFDLKNGTTFLYSISSNINSLDIIANAESNTAKVDIIGNNNFKIGLNVVTISVTENNDEITDYQIIVYKNPSDALVIPDINALFEGNVIFNSEENSSHVVPAEVITKLKNTNSSLYYNVLDSYNGLLYQVILSNNIPFEDIDVSINKMNGNNLTYETKLPAHTEVLLYLDGKYTNGNVVRIYSYNIAGNYTLITDGVTVNNGYVSFITNGETHYLITTNDLLRNQGLIETILKQYGIYIGVGLVAIILIIVINGNKKKKKKLLEKKEEGPSY